MRINSRIFFEAAQKGSPTAEQIFANFETLCASNPFTLAKSIDSYVKSTEEHPKLFEIDKALLQGAAKKFHEKAGTLTESVQKNIDLLATDAPIIRFAFTPYHFAYIGVYTQFIFLDMTANSYTKTTSRQACQLYFNIDGDVVEDKKLHISYIPDVEYATGSLIIKLPVAYSEKHYPIRFVGKPSERVIDQWIELLRTNILHNLAILRNEGVSFSAKEKLVNNFQVIQNEIREAFARSNSLSEFNSIFLSRIINLHWNLPTAFISTSVVSSVMTECYEYLLSQYPRLAEISNAVVSQLQSYNIDIKDNLRVSIDKFPFWYFCDRCSSRTHLTIQSTSKLHVEGRCPTCSEFYHFQLGTIYKPNLRSLYGKIAPKVLIDELTDIVGWRIAGGVDYIGGLNHTLVNSLIAVNLGLKLPPGCLWRPRGIYFGLAEARFLAKASNKEIFQASTKSDQALERVYFGRASILYCLIAQGPKDLYSMWKSHFENGKQTFELNTGPQAFEFSDVQINRLKDKLAKIDYKIQHAGN